MAIFDIFSKRQRARRGDVQDVYTYDQFPKEFRVQIVHIWRDVLGDRQEYNNDNVQTRAAYTFIVETLCREYGVFVLSENREYGFRHYLSELESFLLHEQDTERVLDAIELSFRCIDVMARNWEYRHIVSCAESVDEAIADLNARFREHGIGYSFENQEIIRVDSQLLHAEVVKPALTLLASDTEYKGAQAEFLTAHGHYRHGRQKEALNDSLKAIESVMKAICVKRKWPYSATAPASALLQTLFNNGLIPAFWNTHFTALKSTLESGVPTARNRLGGHGQGTEIIEVPEYLAGYVLHLTASVIVFLVSAEKAL